MKYKIITGFPCNNNSSYMILLVDCEPVVTTNRELFERAMSEGYVELSE